MSDALCPKCRAPLFHDEETPGGNVAIHPGCSACGWEPVAIFSEYPVGGAEAAKAEALATLNADVSPLAWFEPRDRLPTPEEDAAHREKHGERAGWMGRCYVSGMWRNWSAGWGAGPDHLHPVESYPHVNGRPVGWPEVSRG